MLKKYKTLNITKVCYFLLHSFLLKAKLVFAMEKISFNKYTGAGNDFILFDRKENRNLELTPGIIRGLCHRRFGIGADGILVIGEDNNSSFLMEYYNADGSTGTLCGNGARCAIKHAGESGYINDKGNFYCNGTEYFGEIFKNGYVEFALNDVTDFRTDFLIKQDGLSINAHYAENGSPHLVIFNEDIRNESGKMAFVDLDTVPIHELGRKLRYHKNFAPAGLNVNFIAIKENKLYIRTYERGVENETLACGTGSTAAALIASLKCGLHSPVSVIVKSGAELKVKFEYKPGRFEKISLTGPAEKVYNGEIFKNKIIEDLDGKSDLFDQV